MTVIFAFMSIIIENLTKNYSKQRALDNFSLEVKKGSIMGLLGPNGAGKSTLIKILAGYLLPDNGDVFVCGLNLKSNKIDIQRKIGYLPEHNPCYTDMYVREYLEYVAQVYKIKQPKKRIEEILGLVQLDKEAHKLIAKLSKGYRQRVGLAQAIIHNPEVLILDEPTTGFDPNQIVEIRQLILMLSKEKTVILSTHLMQEVEAMCNRVVILNEGKKVIDGDIQEIKNTKHHLLRVTFFEPLTEEIAQKLCATFHDVTFEAPKTVLVKSDQEIELISKSIFEFAVHYHLIIIALEPKKNNLEHIFHSATT